MEYIEIPSVISFKDIKREKTLSPANFKKLNITNSNVLPLKEIIKLPLIDGKEVGSKEYIKKSTKYFIRTKALQSESYLLSINSESVVPIRPQSFKSMDLKEGYVLISKDSNVGEVAYLEKDYPSYMLSGGLKALVILENRYYIMAFLKSVFFKNQLNILISKGATIKHGRTKFLGCVIPFPNQLNKEVLIKYVSELAKAIIRKEWKIKENDEKLNYLIEKELLEHQKESGLNYKLPTFEEIKQNNRLDAGFYCEEFLKEIFLINNYENGYKRLTEMNFMLKPGTTLEIKILKTRVDSDVPKPNYCTLITPTQITDYGTVSQYKYIGIKEDIFQLKKGDVLFGESGTGRSIVVAYENGKVITNAHGNILRPLSGNIEESIFLRCILRYFKLKGIYDFMTVGGSGGHLSPSYFDRIYIPDFSEPKRKEIIAYYYNPIQYDICDLSLSNFEQKDIELTEKSGILELDKQLKVIKQRLDEVVHQIVIDEDVKIDFSFLDESRL
jgi:type I restriction enzyme S subunit